ncbi:MAG: tRNA epoxyqueuosine(34) reductase QueG, partial [Anaerolineae bacterium]|nr:tRNA epoxyqueuosine(34) reductase QueG [Anaerolineae bacterium]
IHPRRGSYFFLGEILTEHEFDSYDAPVFSATMCGSCTRCLRACPTQAFPAPHVLDARRCISYLTIEHKGWIDRDLRPLMSNWVFGCDVCQAVCPFQRFTPEVGSDSLLRMGAHPDRAAPHLLDLLTLDDARFAERFAGTPVERIKRERLVRNACVAAGNWGAPEAAPPLSQLLADPSPLVRGHAAWALGRIHTPAARAALITAQAYEMDAQVRAEIDFTLMSLS